MDSKLRNMNNVRLIAGCAAVLLAILQLVYVVSDIGYYIDYGFNFDFIVRLVAIIGYVMIAIPLLTNKKDLVLVIGVVFYALPVIWYFIDGFRWGFYSVESAWGAYDGVTQRFSFICMMPELLFVVSAIAFAFMAITLSSGKQTEKREQIKAYWFLPTVIYVVAELLDSILYYVIPEWVGKVYPFSTNSIIYSILELVLLLLVCMYCSCVNVHKEDILVSIENEEDMETVPVTKQTVYPDGYYEMVKHIVLLIFTFGVWNFIWTYRVTNFLNKVKGEEPRNATTQVILCIFVPFYLIYWTYKSAERVDKLGAQKGVESDIKIICLIFSIFFYFLAPIFMQDKINNIVMSKKKNIATENAETEEQVKDAVFEKDVEATSAKLSEAKSVAEDLKTYRELLDSGLITQEEFDLKKKQLLGL